jgi:hypothetical protein
MFSVDEIVEIEVPEYEFYIKDHNDKWIPSGDYVRGKIIREIQLNGGSLLYKVKLFVKGEPEYLLNYADLKKVSN